MKKVKPIGPKHVAHEILYGINPVTEALKAGRRRIHTVYLSQNRLSGRMSEVKALAGNNRIPVKTVSDGELTKIAATQAHQNVAAQVGPYPFSTMSDLFETSRFQAPPFLLVLDSIEDPQNLGALARTALAAGVTGIIIPKDRAAMPTASACKASAGALEHIRVVPVTNLVNTIRELKKQDFWITGLDAAGTSSLYDNDFSSPTALIVGGEGRGVRELVRKHCDYLVFIPQQGPLNSLNASVAGALAMFEVVRQRQKQ